MSEFVSRSTTRVSLSGKCSVPCQSPLTSPVATADFAALCAHIATQLANTTNKAIRRLSFHIPFIPHEKHTPVG